MLCDFIILIVVVFSRWTRWKEIFLIRSFSRRNIPCRPEGHPHKLWPAPWHKSRRNVWRPVMQQRELLPIKKESACEKLASLLIPLGFFFALLQYISIYILFGASFEIRDHGSRREERNRWTSSSTSSPKTPRCHWKKKKAYFSLSLFLVHSQEPQRDWCGLNSIDLLL